MAQRIEGNIEVEAPVAEVYDYWKNLENLPNFMSNIENVSMTGPDTSHWKVKGPIGTSVEFDAKTTQNRQNEAIAWNTQGGDVETSGQVRFKEVSAERTRIEVQMNWADPPGGKVGEVVTGMFAGPKTMFEQDLRNFKDIIEGNATPDEVQERAAAANAHSGAVGFLTSSVGLATLGVGFVLWLLLRGRGGKSSGKKSRIIFEF